MITAEDEAKAYVRQIAEMGRVLRAVITTAVDKSPSRAVTLVCDYFDDCGLGDAEINVLIDRWRKENAGL